MAEKKLSVNDGLRFGFGFGAGLTMWLILWVVFVASIVYQGIKSGVLF